MLIPIEWLKQFVTTDKTDQQIADILTLSGTNIEEVTNGVLNAEITPNRADCLSVYGVAREFAAFANEKLQKLEIPAIKPASEKLIDITIENQSLCPRYSGYVIKNVKIIPSPAWLTNRLNLAGIRSINNLVDITNYIMLETGQPLHAFDLDKIINGQMIIRLAKTDESVTTLDGVNRPVNEDSIVIANNHRLIDLAGIMGGAESEISETTTNIFLQAAVFNPINIRRASKFTKLSTDASYRYERGVDIANSLNYLHLAADLFVKYANGTIRQLVDIYPNPTNPTIINWQIAPAEHLLGVKINPNEAIENLAKLDIKTTKKGDSYESQIPTYRPDLNIPADIYEEIIRFYPLNALPRTVLSKTASTKQDDIFVLAETIKDQLVEMGLTEIYGYSFLSDTTVKNTGLNPADSTKISNPLSEDHRYLRPSLLPSLLQAVAQNPSFSPLALFEIGRVFPKNSEQQYLGIILAGTKAEVQNLQTKLQNWQKEHFSDLVNFENINADILKKFKIRKSTIVYFEISLDKLIKPTKPQYLLPKMDHIYRPLTKFESVNRDLAMIVDNSLDPQDIIAAIFNADPLVKNAELFDEFKSAKFGPNKKSLAFHIYYQSAEKTLTDQDAQNAHERVVNQLTNKFKATLRT